MRFVRNACAFVMMCAAVSSTASAQNPPTLRGALEVIRARIAQQGKISYSATIHDSATDRTWGNTFTVEASDTDLDEANCLVRYHWHTTVNGKTVADIDADLQFRKATDIALVSMTEDMAQAVVAAGYSTWGVSVSPQIWVIHLTRSSDGSMSSIDFRDRATAQTVLDAVKQAARLCP